MSYIHTNIATPAAFNEAMGYSVQFYQGVFAAFRQVRTGVTLNNGEISGRRDLIVEELKNTYAARPELVVREAALCNTWRAEYAPRIKANKSLDGWDDLIKIAGKPPLAPDPEQVDKWRPLVATAFGSWAERDYATPATLRKKLEQSLGKQLP